MDRTVSVSPDRVRAVIGTRLPSQYDALVAAFAGAGLTVQSVNVQQAADHVGTILTAAGWHDDKTPFAFVSQAFIGDPIARARQAALDLVIAHTGNPAGAQAMSDTDPATAVAPAKPGDLKSLTARFRARKASFAQKLADTEQKLEEAMAKGEAHLDRHAAEIDAFLDEINQLTNGGPA